ncbi:hypothetical protein H0H93_009748 [Arthromyces matolae]|nr:hypothetical protein H0H93_009748 [Arthromyces matolae]
MPTKYQWLFFDNWASKYGDMIYMKVLGRSFLILTSAKRTMDLLEKRSSNYSDREQLPTLELYQHVQTEEARALARRLLDDDGNFAQHIRQTSATILMKVTYGLSLVDNDEYMVNAEIANDALAGSGATLLDLFPILKYVPVWFPGTNFQRKAAHIKQLIQNMVDFPFNKVKQDMLNGIVRPSIVANMLEHFQDFQRNDDEETIAKNTMGAVYIGGFNTTASSIQSFVLAMAMYPEVQLKAHTEIDAVVGRHGRLPDFSDKDSLPYVNAIVKEILRWKPVTPQIAHYSAEDDEYDGYFIPARTTVIGNAWSILHDPEMYTNPEEFDPDRFLKNGKLDGNIRDPGLAAFGFGRRLCPGRHFAENSIYSIIVALLAVTKIEPPIDEAGNLLPLSGSMSSGLLSCAFSILKPPK